VRWSRDGREILDVAEKGLMKVPVTPGRGETPPSFGQPSLTLPLEGMENFARRQDDCDHAGADREGGPRDPRGRELD
jgi:hypothetical protein